MGLEFNKCKSRFRMSRLKILCRTIWRQSGQVLIFGPKFAETLILVSDFQDSKYSFRINIVEILCAPSSWKNGQPWIVGRKFPKNGFWRWNFKNVSLDLEWASLSNYVHCAPISKQNLQFWIFGPKFALKAIAVLEF